MERVKRLTVPNDKDNGGVQPQSKRKSDSLVDLTKRIRISDSPLMSDLTDLRKALAEHETNYFTWLPHELIQNIFEWLDIHDVLMLTSLCSQFHQQRSNELMWKGICHRLWRDLEFVDPISTPTPLPVPTEGDKGVRTRSRTAAENGADQSPQSNRSSPNVCPRNTSNRNLYRNTSIKDALNQNGRIKKRSMVSEVLPEPILPVDRTWRWLAMCLNKEIDSFSEKSYTGLGHAYKIENFSDCYLFIGDWKSGSVHGKALEISTKKHYYIGDFLMGMREGEGSMNWVYCKETEQRKACYVGQWNNGRRNGKGTMKWSTGVRYEGDWKDNVEEGHGTIYFSNNEKYEGKWRNGLREGNGRYTWPSGSYYDGVWKGGQKDGDGTMVWIEGSLKVETVWKNGQQVSKRTLS